MLGYQWIKKKNSLGSWDQNSRFLSFPLQFLNFLPSCTDTVLKKAPKIEMLPFCLALPCHALPSLPFLSLLFLSFSSFSVPFFPFVSCVLILASCYSPSQISWPCSLLCSSVHVYLYSEECCLPTLASSLFSSPVSQDCSHPFASQAPWRLHINPKRGDKDIIKRCVCFKTDIEKYLICSHQQPITFES